MKYVISAAAILLVNAGAFALPQGGRIESGKGNLDNPAHIIQESQHLQTRWNSFDIGAAERVRIEQPNAQSSINIKVRNGAATNINGTLTANGRVSLENPAGIQFGANSVVNVGGLLASSAKGAVTSLGQVSAAEVVRFQGLSGKSIVNVGGAVSAQEIIVEGNGDIVIGNSAHFTASKQVLIGGGYQGKDLGVLNAQTTDVKAAAQINAPRVIVWSDKVTRFLGRIDAGRGFVEVSGKQTLIFPDISRAKAGTLLLDPENLSIIAVSRAADVHISGDGILLANEDADSLSGTLTLSTFAIQAYNGNVSLAARRKFTLNFGADITKSNGSLILSANSFAISGAITISGKDNYLSLELMGVPTGATFLFSAGAGNIITDDLRIAINYTGSNIQFSPTSTVTGVLEAPGRKVTIETPTHINVVFSHGFDLCAADGSGCGNLSVTAGRVNPMGTFAADNFSVTATRTRIIFGSGATVKANSIRLTQVDEFIGSAPADFGTTMPTIVRTGGTQAAVSWANLVVIEDITVDAVGADIVLADELTTGAFSIVGGVLDLGTYNLSLTTTGTITLPAGLTRITTTGSITMMASAIDSGTQDTLTLNATGTLTLGGTFNYNVLTLVADTLNLTATNKLAQAPSFGSSLNLTYGTLQGTPTLSRVETLTVTTTGTGKQTFDAATASWFAEDDLNATFNTAGDLELVGTMIATTNNTLTFNARGNGRIIFTGNPSIRADNIVFSQGSLEGYPTAKPADFGASVVTIDDRHGEVSWAGGGLTLQPGNITVGDGNLEAAVRGKFDISNGVLDLSGFNLQVVGTLALVVPAGITRITTMDFISIGTGLTATAALAVDTSNVLTVRGTWNLGGNALTLTTGTGAIVFLHPIDITAGSIVLTQVDSYATTAPAVFSTPPTLNSATSFTKPTSWGVCGMNCLASLAPGDIMVTDGNLTTAVADKFDLSGITLDLGSFNLTVSGSPLVVPSNITTIRAAGISITGGLTATAALHLDAGTMVLGGIFTADSNAFTFTSATLTSVNAITAASNLTISSALVMAATSLGSAGFDLTLAGVSSSNPVTTLRGANITLNGAVNVGGNALTITAAGGITFTGNPMIEASSIALTQADEFPRSAPANFNVMPSIVRTGAAQRAVSWATGGVLVAADVIVTDGNLAGALVGKFIVPADGSLDLGSFSLMSSGTTTLTIPSTITSITTNGSISITGGLTKTGGGSLTLNSDTIVLGGTFAVGSLFLNERSGSNIAITAASNLTINGSLTLSAAVSSFGSAGFDLTLSNAKVGSSTAPFALRGANITLNAAIAGTSSRLTITADNNIVVRSSTASSHLTLTAMAGGITFVGNPTITATIITLSQTVPYAATAPANFFRVPTLTSPNNFNKPSWGTCGANCFQPMNLNITNGNLTTAIAGKFFFSSDSLDLGGYSLTSSGMPLVIPAGIRYIQTSGTIRVTGGLTAPGEMGFVADNVELGGTFTAGDFYLSELNSASVAITVASNLTMNANVIMGEGVISLGSAGFDLTLSTISGGSTGGGMLALLGANIMLNGTVNGKAAALTITAAGGITFASTSTAITAASIALTQADAYAVSVPANFNNPPTLNSLTSFTKPASWGVCGTNCTVPLGPGNVVVIDGDLEKALIGKFALSGTSLDRLDLGAFNLTSSGMPLVIPASITSIVSDGTISITGGLTASGNLDFFADTIELGGTFETTTGRFRFGESNNVVRISVAADLTFNSHVIVLSQAYSLGSTGFNLTFDSIETQYASFVLSGKNITLNGALTAAGSITITAANDLFVNNTITAGTALALTATAGGITFASTSTAITAPSIALTQADAYAVSVPATFNNPPTLNGSTPFIKPSWGVCGTSCTGPLVPGNIMVTDGNLTTAIVGKFIVSGSILDLGSFSLTSSGVPLVVPAGILRISSLGGTISIRGGLTASGLLEIFTDNMELGGTFETSTGSFRLGEGNVEVNVTAVADLTFNSPVVMLAATPSLGSTGFNLTFNSIETNYASFVLSGKNITLNGALTAAGSITITAANDLFVNNTITVTNALVLTATAGGITFASTSTAIAAASIALSQMDPYAASAPATFTPAPTLNSLTSFTRPAAWGVCGDNCTAPLVPKDISFFELTGSYNLADEIVGFFEIDANGVLDLGNFILEFVVSGSLTFPSTLKEIRTTSRISLNIGTSAIGGVGSSLKLTAGSIIFNGNLDFGATALSLNATTFNLTGNGDHHITANSIEFDAGATGDKRGLTFIATTGSVTINSDLDVTGHSLTLTANAGAVVFTGNPMIKAISIALSQMDPYAASAPATFTPTPTLNSLTSFNKPAAWGTCGTNCSIPLVGQNLDITDGNLEMALVGTFDISGTTLDLGTYNLMASGMPLTVPSTITTITTTGTISITGGLTTSAALSLSAGTALTIGGTWGLGTNALALTAGAGAIGFNNGSVITAGTITLTQVAEFPRVAPTTVSFGSTTPAIVRTGVALQRTVPWATGGDATLAGDVIVDAGNADINLADEIAGYFVIDASGILSIDAFTLSLTTTGTIILPTNLSSIVGIGVSNISLSAGGISGGSATTFSATAGTLALKGTFDFGTATVSFSGGTQLDFSKGAVSITAGTLTITGATNSSGSLAGSDPLTFTATGTLTLNGHIGASATPINLSYGGILGGTPTLATSALSVIHTGVDATPLPSWIFGGYSTTLTASGIDIVAATTWTGNSITFTGDTNIAGNDALTLNVSTVAAGTNNLTINLPSLTLGNSTTITAANITLTASAGGIDFGTGSTITATAAITLSQTDPYVTSRPAAFTPAPTLTAPSSFNKPTAWGVCGANCFAPESLTITDGNLETALVGKFDVSSGTLDLGFLNLTAHTMALTIPAGITTITTTGRISIADGLTATAALNLHAAGGTAPALGGTFTSSNTLTLTSANAITAGSALTISSALIVAAPSLGSADADLTLTGNVSSSGSSALALVGSNITLGVGTFTTGTLTLTSANAITASSDLTISSALVVAAPSLGSTGFSLNLQGVTSSIALALVGSTITLNDAVNVGGALTITAAAGAIGFSNTPLITGSTITLTQVDVFPRDAPAATFSVTPAIVRSGGAEQRAVPWATGGMTIAGEINFFAVSHDVNLEEAIIGYFAIDGNGILDLGAFDLTLATSGKVIFPANLKEIRTTGDIQLNATNGIEGFGSQFALVASDLFLSGGLDFGATALSLRATTTLDLLGTAAATISADSIEFDVASIANGAALTLTARTGSLTLSGDINLGTAFTDLLNLNFATTLEQGATAPTITAGEIIVRHTGSGAITLPEWLFTGQNVNLSVAAITLSADTTWDVRRLDFGRDTTITGTTHALTLAIPPSENFISAIGRVLTIDVGSLSFSSKVALAAGNLNITTRTAGADNAFDLTLIGADGLTVAGHINAGTGALILGADRAKIIFTNNPTITGATITLAQNATYDHDVPAQFSVTPIASRTGLATGTVYAITTWADCPAGDALCVAPENIALIDQTVDIILTDVIASKFAISGNTLDLLGSSLELSTTANIILPAGLTTITTSGNVTLVGASIITAGGGTQIGAALTVEANALTLGGAINAGSFNLTFTTSGGSLRFATATTINGAAIILLGGDNTISSPANVALVVTSSSTLALAGVVNVGTSSIVLTAGAGIIDFSSATGIIGNLTAATITLTQVDAYRVTRPGTFSVPPALNRSGSDNFNTPSWGVCGVDPQCFLSVDIDFTAAGDAALVDIIGSNFFIAGGVLNLGSSSLSIDIGGTLTLPAGLIQIVTAGNNITLTVGTFSAPANMTIQTTGSGDITLQGSYVVASTFSLFSAGAVNFGTGAETSITSGSLSLFGNAAATASGQKLTLSGGFQVGSLDINVAELVLNTALITGAAPTLTADDLTLNYPGTQAGIAVFAGSHWMFAAGRNVTVRTTNSGLNMVLFAANATDSINLCAADGTCGSLTLESAGEIQLAGSTQTSASLGTISANNITLKAGTRIGSDSTDINRNLTINAAGDLTIDTPTFTLRNMFGTALTFGVAGSTTFTQDITLDAETMSGLGGTITAAALTLATAASATGSITFDATRATDITTTGALSMDAVTITEFGGTIIAPTLTLTTGSSATGSIAFSTTQAINITTGALSMDAATITAFGGTLAIESLMLSSGGSTTGSLGFSTTRATDIITTGNIIFEFESATATPSGQNLTLTATGGDITLGTLNIGSGTLEVTTDQNIAFTSNPTITALEIYLTWEGTTDFGATAPATFTDGSTAPPLPYIEAANQTAGTWFQLAGFSIDAGAADIDFSAPVTLNRGADTLVVSVTAAGVLDFGANVVRLTTTGNIIFPASVREILASDLTINATTTGSGATAAPFANPLSITTTEDLELNTTLAMAAGVALNLTFAGTLEGALTLTATNLGITSTATTGATTLPSWVFGDAARALRLSVANITFSSDETWVAASITFAADTSITSTDQLLLNTPTLNAGANSLTINVARLNFFGTSASTITGGAVSLTASTVSGGGSGQALNITATTGNLTLAGELSIGAGAMTLTATQGVISFTSTPILTAASFLLTQGGAAFAAIKPADFQNAAGTDVRPTISYTAGVQLPVDWDVLTVFEMLTETAGGGFDLNILTSTGGGLVGFETSPGVLDFGNLDVILGTDNNITIPDRITEIRGRNIIIRAETFGRGTTAVADPLNGNIQFVATENIIFRADVQSDSRITFTGRSITFNNTKATQISGSEILITTTNPGLANNQNVTLNATGDITLDANLNLGVGTLVVNATGAIVTTDATTITAYTIFYHAAAIRNGSNDVTLTAYDNIYLRGTNLSNRDAAVSLTAGGSIVTRGAFDITGSAVHFEQGQARYQAGRLTLHALTGGLTIVGPIAREMLTLTVSSPAQLDRSNAVIEGAVTVVVSP